MNLDKWEGEILPTLSLYFFRIYIRISSRSYIRSSDTNPDGTS